MALEDILEAILVEAEDRAGRIVAEAAERADALVEDAHAVAASREEELAHAADERIARERRRTLSLAVLEASRARRAAREEVVELVIAEVCDVLRGLRSDLRYGEVLARLFAEAVAVLPEPGIVEVHPDDRERVERLLADRGLVAPVRTSDDMWGGVTIRSDGRIVRNDLESRLRRAEPHLRFIAGEVFPSLRAGAE